MNIEDLNKTQLLLLTLLVNFVTAIATAVLTVSLLEQAPPPVTQTVNRIVERTVQTVEQQVPLAGIVSPQPPRETVIVREENLLAAAIRADAERRITIHRGASSTAPVAVGTYLSDKRVVVTATMQGLPREATIVFANGESAEASLAHNGATLSIYGFADAATLPAAAAPKILSSTDLQQGQTLVALTREGAAVSGIISLVATEGIRSNVSGVPAGAAAVNLSGDLIGIATAQPGIFAPAERIGILLSTES